MSFHRLPPGPVPTEPLIDDGCTAQPMVGAHQVIASALATSDKPHAVLSVGNSQKAKLPTSSGSRGRRRR